MIIHDNHPGISRVCESSFLEQIKFMYNFICVYISCLSQFERVTIMSVASQRQQCSPKEANYTIIIINAHYYYHY